MSLVSFLSGGILETSNKNSRLKVNVVGFKNYISICLAITVALSVPIGLMVFMLGPSLTGEDNNFKYLIPFLVYDPLAIFLIWKLKK